MKGKKIFTRFSLLLLCIYGLFFICGALLYPKIKIQQIEDSEKIERFDQDNFFDITNTSEKVSLLSDRDDSLALRCNLIDKAKKNIYITQYAIEDDETGDIFINHLLKAADRGIHIHIICNGMAIKWKLGSLYKKIALFSHPNIKVRIYGGIQFLKPWTINNVMHDKLMIIDRNYFLSSGRNIGNRFMLPNIKKQKTNDMDIIVESKEQHHPIIDTGINYFYQIWKSPYTHKSGICGNISSSLIIRWANQRMMNTSKEVEVHYEKELNRNILNKLNFVSIERAKLVHNNPNENIKTPMIWQTISQLINSDGNLLLQTPYLVIDNHMYNYLSISHLKQNKKKVLTNSEATSPNLFAYAAYLSNKHRDLNYFDIDEYQGEGSLHNKGFLYQEDIVGIGSFNIDPRSSFLDSENMLMIQSEALADQFRKEIQKYQSQSLMCKTDTSYISKTSLNIKKVKGVKQVLMKIMSVLIRPFSYLT